MLRATIKLSVKRDCGYVFVALCHKKRGCLSFVPRMLNEYGDGPFSVTQDPDDPDWYINHKKAYDGLEYPLWHWHKSWVGVVGINEPVLKAARHPRSLYTVRRFNQHGWHVQVASKETFNLKSSVAIFFKKSDADEWAARKNTEATK